jgi:hypothetical protein
MAQGKKGMRYGEDSQHCLSWTATVGVERVRRRRRCIQASVSSSYHIVIIYHSSPIPTSQFIRKPNKEEELNTSIMST